MFNIRLITKKKNFVNLVNCKKKLPCSRFPVPYATIFLKSPFATESF